MTAAQKNNAWLEKRALRSVDQLKLWTNNPRLDPLENYITVADFADELVRAKTDRDDFVKLVRSIAVNGFLSFEPVIVWQDDKGKFVVAEGNRRVLVLKLLRNPEKSPRSIRGTLRKYAALINRNEIEKIQVVVAPSFDDCEWYLLQRHSTSSLQKPWERLQQQRWLEHLSDKYGNDFEIIKARTGFTQNEIEKTLRYVKIRNLAVRDEVLSQMSPHEIELIHSHKIPMTIIERWFDSAEVRETWGLKYDGKDIRIESNEASFLRAFSVLLKIILTEDAASNYKIKINTRTVPEKNKEILAILPKVTFGQCDEPKNSKSEGPEEAEGPDVDSDEPKDKSSTEDTTDKTTLKKKLLGNPDRNQMNEQASINVSSHKLDALFKELSKLPVGRYSNIAAASLRVFLELSVDEFICSEGLNASMAKEKKKAYDEISLRDRLSFIDGDYVTEKGAKNVIRDLLTNGNEYSLETLNIYIHGTTAHHTSKRRLNGFWDMLNPLFKVLIDMKDK